MIPIRAGQQQTGCVKGDRTGGKGLQNKTGNTNLKKNPSRPEHRKQHTKTKSMTVLTWLNWLNGLASRQQLEALGKLLKRYKHEDILFTLFLQVIFAYFIYLSLKSTLCDIALFQLERKISSIMV